VALFGLVTANATVGQSMRIPNDSMVPALRFGEGTLISHVAYGFHSPRLRPGSASTLPSLGDIVEHRVAGSADEFPATLYVRHVSVHRVVGGPGDRVEFVNGALILNGRPASDGTTSPLTWVDKECQTRVGTAHLEQIGSVSYNVLHGGGDFGPVIVGPDAVFVAGDNRERTSDSRLYGGIPSRDIIGKSVGNSVSPVRDPCTRHSFSDFANGS
jgi:signal peptidase I